MKALTILVLACLGSMWAQSSPPSARALPDLPDETPIAVFDDGVQLTMGEFRKIFAALPGQNQQMALVNRKMFLQQWAFMRKLAQTAEKQKLDQEGPTKYALEYYRMMLLSQAELNNALNTTTVEPEEIVQFYDSDKERFKQVKVKAIYVSFRSTPASEANSGAKARTEDEARAKAEMLLASIRAGADFVKLVKENSEDETSKAKDGDFATLRPADNIPDAIRSAVFALKPGEVSEPVRQPNGFYLLRADEVSYLPLAQVRDEIFTQLKQQHYAKWLEQANRDTKVQFPSPAFLGAAAAAPSK